MEYYSTCDFPGHSGYAHGKGTKLAINAALYKYSKTCIIRPL